MRCSTASVDDVGRHRTDPDPGLERVEIVGVGKANVLTSSHERSLGGGELGHRVGPHPKSVAHHLEQRRHVLGAPADPRGLPLVVVRAGAERSRASVVGRASADDARSREVEHSAA